MYKITYGLIHRNGTVSEFDTYYFDQPNMADARLFSDDHLGQYLLLRPPLTSIQYKIDIYTV